MTRRTEPLIRKVRSSGGKYPKGRINLPSRWINKEVIIAPKESYVVLSKKDYKQMKKIFDNSMFLRELFESILNSNSGSKMFSIVSKTWNPVTGCLHECSYCWARKLAETKLRNSHRYRKGFLPRLNENEFKAKFNEGDFIFVSDMGDLFGGFIPKKWILQVLNYIRKFPKTYFLLLTKNPSRYKEFIEEFSENIILGTTIETNKDDLYLENKISKAPLPSVRYESFKEIKWSKKFVSIEPILDFDLEEFAKWIEQIMPIMIYIGYDNYSNRLPEPPLSKTMKLISRLSKTTLVIKKTLRPAWYETLKQSVFLEDMK